ncbi:MAG: outer membrane lipoprotein carrier protein LolA [Rikenellaceae bacterium]|nr:outer membrane lipoprotein carrier protein LolA [Rikenellaceae bacterium]
MKKFIAFIFTLLCAANVCAQSDDSAKVLIGRLSEKIRAMENYEVEFNVKSGDQTIKGYYAVSGEKYYISIGDAEVYCDGSARYEVNPQNKEVTVDAVDTKSHNILTNPTRAFDFIDGEFTFATVGVADGATTIKLTSTAENAALGTIFVTIDNATAQPRSLTYDVDGDQIVVEIASLDEMVGMVDISMFTFDKGNYRGYEIVDFR